MKHISIRRREAERGQSLVVTTLLLMGLLGMAAIVVDLGQMWTARRALQAATDASALAGASQLGAGWSAARDTAAAEWANNGKASDSVSYAPATDAVAGDSIVVSASRTMPSIFAQLFGLGTETVSASSRATIETYTTVGAGQDIMPWAVMKTDFQVGAAYSLYGDKTSNPTYGGLALPVEQDGCSEASPNDYRGLIAGTLSNCAVSVGDQYHLLNGADAGNTCHGLEARLGSPPVFEPLSKIASIDAQGNATILEPDSPQVVLVPLITALDGSSSWPSGGNAQVRIAGFAWFIITGDGNAPSCAQAKEVDGVFVRVAAPDVGQSGAWDPTASAQTVALTS